MRGVPKYKVGWERLASAYLVEVELVASEINVHVVIIGECVHAEGSNDFLMRINDRCN